MAQSLIQTLSPSEQPRAAQADERSSLLGQFPSSRRSSKKTQGADPKVRAWVWGPLTVLFVAALVILLGFFHSLPTALILWLGELPRDPMLAALAILDKAPVLVRSFLPHFYRAQKLLRMDTLVILVESYVIHTF